jgi:hypothetical protein
MSHSAQVALCFILILLLLNFFSLFHSSYSFSAETVEISDEANLRVYAIDLDGVGNRWATNRSEVVEGVLQAAEVRRVTVPLFDRFGYIVDYIVVNVTVTAEVVTEWNVYRSLVETGSNAIIVNAHDEYLPIPNEYSREQWVGRIADFMLNRSGTWVHTGGYPMNLTWHENGNVETWGEGGFQTLMDNVGKGNVDCRITLNQDHLTSTFSIYATQWLPLDFFLSTDRYPNALPISTFHGVNTSYPLKFDDFGNDYLELPIYEAIINGKLYWEGAAIRFSPNAVASKFGIYVHLGSSEFSDGNGDSLNRFADLGMGFVTTAAAIWIEVDMSVQKFHKALEAVETAKEEGRTSGLVEAERLVQQAAEAYNSSSFKMSVVYAEQAAKLAEEAIVEKGSTLPFVLAATGVAVGTTGFIASFLFRKRRKDKC